MKKLNLLTVLSVFFIAPAFVQATPVAKGKGGMMMQEPSKEDRAKMATMHEQMAGCLKSDKKFSECHDQMAKSCPMMGDGKCFMMKHHDHGGKKPSASGDHSGNAH